MVLDRGYQPTSTRLWKSKQLISMEFKPQPIFVYEKERLINLLDTDTKSLKRIVLDLPSQVKVPFLNNI
jgi:hypothetical protein